MSPIPAIETQQTGALVAIKTVHTVIWVFFVTCILGIPVAGLLGRFGLAWILTGLVLFECAILAVNRGRCPLTDVAARFTVDRRPQFDIYLPAWVARWNKELFGAIFVAGTLLALWLRLHPR